MVKVVGKVLELREPQHSKAPWKVVIDTGGKKVYGVRWGDPPGELDRVYAFEGEWKKNTFNGKTYTELSIQEVREPSASDLQSHVTRDRRLEVMWALRTAAQAVGNIALDEETWSNKVRDTAVDLLALLNVLSLGDLPEREE